MLKIKHKIKSKNIYILYNFCKFVLSCQRDVGNGQSIRRNV